MANYTLNAMLKWFAFSLFSERKKNNMNNVSSSSAILGTKSWQIWHWCRWLNVTKIPPFDYEFFIEILPLNFFFTLKNDHAWYFTKYFIKINQNVQRYQFHSTTYPNSVTSVVLKCIKFVLMRFLYFTSSVLH